MASRRKFKCCVTVKDISSAASAACGWRVSMNVVRHVRSALAQEWCDKHYDDMEKGCINNPFIPRKMIGSNYIFTPGAANRLLRHVVERASAGHARGAIKRSVQRRLAVA